MGHPQRVMSANPLLIALHQRWTCATFKTHWVLFGVYFAALVPSIVMPQTRALGLSAFHLLILFPLAGGMSRQLTIPRSLAVGLALTVALAFGAKGLIGRSWPDALIPLFGLIMSFMVGLLVFQPAALATPEATGEAT